MSKLRLDSNQQLKTKNIVSKQAKDDKIYL